MNTLSTQASGTVPAVVTIDLLGRIESYGFTSEAGPLELCEEWQKLKQAADLWVVVKRDALVQHTLGKGGWRFTVCTNRDEAQALADTWNERNYDGQPICTIRPFLSA
jgi:hypothetical protein